MTLLPLLVLASSPRQGDLNEVARARAFIRAAHVGLNDAVLPMTEPDAEPWRIDDEERFKVRERTYWFPTGTVIFQVPTGRITGYFAENIPYTPLYNQGIPIPRAVTDNDAAILARRFHEASGWPGEIDPYRFEDLAGTSGYCISVDYRPVYRGVPYEGCDGRACVNRMSGLLESFDSPPVRMPAPPASLVAATGARDAPAAAFRAALAWRGGALRESAGDPLRLRLWSPGQEYPVKVGVRSGRFDRFAFRDADRALFSAGRARLVYSGTLIDEAGRPLWVHMDAQDGHVLSMRSPSPAGGGSGGLSSPPPAPKPFAVPAAPRPWRVAVGGGAWSAPATAALTPASAKGPTLGRALLLTDGRTGFRAVYDARRGLLGVEGKTYRPGPALASLLRRKGAGRN